jgi:hypothetical protein
MQKRHRPVRARRAPVKVQQKPTAQPVSNDEQSAAWVRGMRLHFQQTGYYRASDLERLLGDPRQSVEVEATPDMLLCAHK